MPDRKPMPLWFIPIGVLCAPVLLVWYVGMYALGVACGLAAWAWKSLTEGH